MWDAIALHTTPGIPAHKKPVVALVTSGVEMDVLGMSYEDFTSEQRKEVVAARPRLGNFKEEIIDAFSQGMIYRPFSTFRTVNADVLVLKDPSYRRLNFCSIILGSAWNDSEQNVTALVAIRHISTARSSNESSGSRLALSAPRVVRLHRCNIAPRRTIGASYRQDHLQVLDTKD